MAQIEAFAGEAGSTSARQKGRVEPAAPVDRRLCVAVIARYDDSDGDLPVIRRIRRVKRAAAGVEPHLAAHIAPQRGFELLDVELDGWILGGGEKGRT